MSKESYMAGFCKKAEAHNIDPHALARFAVQKAAADAPAGGTGAAQPGIWAKVMDAINEAKAAAGRATGDAKLWLDKHPAAKALAGAGVGSVVGTGLGAALAGKKGLRAGAILGAIGGAGASVDWNALSEHLGKLKGGAEKRKADAEAAAAASAKAEQGKA